LKSALELIPGSSHPMDVMKLGCGFYGTLFPESPSRNQFEIFNSLIAVFASILLYWYHFHTSKKRIDTRGVKGDTIAKHLLRLMKNDGKEPLDYHIKTMDQSLTLYAEHGFAASTFACRVTTSTLADIYSSIETAIGTLRGPLHGGANEQAYYLISQFQSPDEAERGLLKMLKEKKLIMGFGHRVYKKSDPRNPIIKECSRKLSQSPTGNPTMFAISQRIEKVMWDEKKNVSEFRFLFSLCLSSMWNSNQFLYSDFCYCPNIRLGSTYN